MKCCVFNKSIGCCFEVVVMLSFRLYSDDDDSSEYGYNLSLEEERFFCVFVDCIFFVVLMLVLLELVLMKVLVFVLWILVLCML